MLRYLTAGESHGQALTTIIDGMPSNLPLDMNRINRMMNLRKSGYGRGGRQSIETDEITILSGVRNGLTTGNPIAILVKNRDYQNWEPIMNPLSADTTQRTVTAVRPGHADLTGALKYGHTDARNVLERASARETAARVAAGAVARELLMNLGVRTTAYVYDVGGVSDAREYSFDEVVRGVEHSDLRCVNAEVESAMKERIERAKREKDTCGGRIRVLVRGLKPGLGDFTQYDRKLDAALAFALMSIQAVKGVEVGLGYGFSEQSGSEVLDEIVCEDGKIHRTTNRSGGIEGGMTNGEDVVLSLAMKPIPTLLSPLNTIDLLTREPVKAAFERSDTCAVTACSVVAECAVSFELAKFVLEAVGSRNFKEIERIWSQCECL